MKELSTEKSIEPYAAGSPSSTDFADGSEEILQLVSFTLAGENYGCEVIHVQEINRLSDLTRVPKAPQYVDGVVNLRGKILPVINFRRLLGFPSASEITEDMRTIVVNAEGILAGLTVDSVNQVIRIPRKDIEGRQDFNMAGSFGDAITGVGHLDDTLVTIIDIMSLLRRHQSDVSGTGR